ncbi:MAG: hypothetical protein Q4B36_02255 [Tissierellia bacterium]|nr:hypothetical protein [Tissierellia bacterium]
MKKSLKKIGIVIIVVFAIYCLVWFINSRYVYTPFTEHVPKHESGLYVYHDDKTDYTYNVKFPEFPKFTGNLGVVDNEGSGLIIWPGFFGTNYEYGVSIKDNNRTYEINLDKNMNIIDKDEELKEVYENNKDLIKEMWDSVKDIWGNKLDI